MSAPERRRPLVGVPGCDTGPAGRLAFVVSEARAAWRSRRSRRRHPNVIVIPAPDTDDRGVQ